MTHPPQPNELHWAFTSQTTH